MSKTRGWWPYVKYMIRVYPKHCTELNDLHEQSITAAYSGMPSSGAAHRTTESSAIRELPSNDQREYAAVKRAIDDTKRKADGTERLRLIDMVFWRQTHTINGAADVLHVSERTAREWHRMFIWSVAEYYGLTD